MRYESLPESSPSPWSMTRVSLRAGLPLGIAYSLAYSFSKRWEGQEVPGWVVLTVIGASLALGGIGAYYWARWIAALDELQQILQLKAFALATPLFLGLMMTADLLRRGGLVGFRMDGYWWVPVFVALHFAAFVWFWRRNR